MQDQEITVGLDGLTKLDKLELDGTPGVTFEEVPVPRGAHGELTVFAAYFAVTALAALAAYLLRTHTEDTGAAAVRIVHKDGRIEERVIRWNKKTSKAPEADIIREILGGDVAKMAGSGAAITAGSAPGAAPAAAAPAAGEAAGADTGQDA